MYKLRIAVRNSIRDILKSDIRAKPREKGYLEEFPWLVPLIPLGRAVAPDGIKVKRLDLDAMSDWLFHQVYLVDKAGVVLTSVWIDRFLGLSGFPLVPHMADIVEGILRKSRDVVDQTHFVVATAGFFTKYRDKTCGPPVLFHASLYKLSKVEAPSTHMARLLDEYRASEKRKVLLKLASEEQERIDARREAHTF